jgi:OTT_1508-like deaminase
LVQEPLLRWDGTSTATQALHCEVNLDLDCLDRCRRGKVVIGVSKQPYFCCESWFDAVSAKAKRIRFILATGHRKLYPGWSPSGIEDGGKKVIAGVWEMVNGIVDELKRIEDKDLVAALPLTSTEIDFEDVEIVIFCYII